MEEKFWQAAGQEEGRNSAFRTKRDLNSPLPGALFAGFSLEKVKNKNTFGKQEKLKSAKTIEQLFLKGKSVSHNGFTLVYLFTPLHSPYPAQGGK